MTEGPKNKWWIQTLLNVSYFSPLFHEKARKKLIKWPQISADLLNLYFFSVFVLRPFNQYTIWTSHCCLSVLLIPIRVKRQGEGCSRKLLAEIPVSVTYFKVKAIARHSMWMFECQFKDTHAPQVHYILPTKSVLKVTFAFILACENDQSDLLQHWNFTCFFKYCRVMM